MSELFSNAPGRYLSLPCDFCRDRDYDYYWIIFGSARPAARACQACNALIFGHIGSPKVIARALGVAP